jgi:hypothetical protein
MNRRLLITLGDSWTLGSGVYTEETHQKYKQNNRVYHPFSDEDRKLFDKYNWGRVLSNKINADNINLAIGGGANSGTAKHFLNGPYENLLQKYDDVIVIFLITEPTRFSFYDNGCTKNFIAKYSDNIPFVEEYIKNVLSDVKRDGALETAFYLKAVESFCAANNYHFFYGSAFVDLRAIDPYFYRHDKVVHNYSGFNGASVCFDSLLTPDMLAPCDHPNKLGNEFIADNLENFLKNKLPEMFYEK